MKLSSRYVTTVNKGDLVCLNVQHPSAQACIALQGAQVLQYTPAGVQPVIWLSERAEYKIGQPLRGGIPLCWPWFGDLQKNPAMVQAQRASPKPSAHGWARSTLWQLDSVVDADDGVTLILSIDDELLSQMSVPVRVRLQIEIGAQLKLRLINEHRFSASTTAAETVALTQALHTYFSVSDIDNVRVEGLAAVTYLDMMRDWQAFSDGDPVRISGETDRIYQGNVADVCLRDAGWQRNIRVRSTNSRSLVLWNPHIEKSLRLSQFSPDAWRQMLCLETGNVMDDVVILAPGEQHMLQVEIVVEPF